MQRLKPDKRCKPYDRDYLKKAYEATLSGMSVYRAARVYKVPESTLRDRTRHKVDIDCQNGGIRIFNKYEEKQLVDHIVYMAKIGYGYTITDIQHIAGDFARSIGKTVRAKDALSQGWMYSFLGRWEELRVVKPQKLTLSRAKSASKETISNYFIELGSILKENGLLNAPERIYNIDESGFSTEHTPPKIVCGSDIKPQAVTSARSKTVTIIGGANAIGNHVPPFYIFPGKRWCESLLEGSVPGSDAGMSKSGFVNRNLFETYLTGHFSKHVGLSKGTDKPTTLILYDGHKSHMSLTLANWAKDHSVILFVLPPHSSHLTQPLDVGVFGPMKQYYNKECKTYMHANPGVFITRYEVAKLTAGPYTRAFSPENIISAFRKAGICPFNNEIINESQTAPSSIYNSKQDNDQEPENNCTTTATESLPLEQNQETISFLDSKKIYSAIQKPKRKFIPPFKVQGNLMSDANIQTLQEQHDKQAQAMKKTNKAGTKIENKNKLKHTSSPKPSTSSNSKNEGAPINLDSSSSDEEDDSEPCCVCNKTFPPQLRGIDTLVIVKWAQCDNCRHWVHLVYCSKVRVVRRGSTFYCKHCPEE